MNLNKPQTRGQDHLAPCLGFLIHRSYFQAIIIGKRPPGGSW